MRTVMLASASPRRLDLLRQAGLHVIPRPVACDESRRAGEPPIDFATRVAADKLRAAQAALEAEAPRASNPHDADWLAADTVVWSTDGVFGKPADRDEAKRMLTHLSRAPHRVTTGWALDGPAGFEAHAETTEVHMRPLDDEELDRYLAGDAWRDKAGGYGIQAEAASWVLRVQGSYTNVVGLPLAQVLLRLQARSTNR